MIQTMVVSHRRTSKWTVLQSSLQILVTTFLLLSASAARAEVLFEGYSKILIAGKHVGFTVQRYEFDPKKKEFTAISYLKTNEAGGNITESLKARASASLAPISYQYTSLEGTKAKMIDGTVKGDVMTLTIKEGAKPAVSTKKVPKGAFFASFLGYVMLQGPAGIKTGEKYGYQAVAEEDGNIYTGEAAITGEEAILGVSAFKVLNTFKGARFVSHVTHKGEVIATRSPVQQIETELVASLQDATAGLSVNTSNLGILFGGIPKGAENVIARKASSGGANAAAAAIETKDKKQILSGTPVPADANPKKEGVPGGQGMMMKGAPAPATTPASR